MKPKRKAVKPRVDVLIVEHSTTEAAKLKRLLKKDGYKVKTVANGEVALTSARRYLPSLIISGVLTRLMNGYELCSAIKSDKALKDIPVVLLTSLSEPQDVIRGLKAGADHYLIKPYHAEYLLAKVRSFLTLSDRKKTAQTGETSEVTSADGSYITASDYRQILDLLLSTHSTAVQKRVDLIRMQLELKKANGQLRQEIVRRKQLSDRLAVIGQMATCVAHEIKSPLNSINGFAQLLTSAKEKKKIRDKTEEYARIIVRDARRIDKTVTDILGFAREVRIEKKPVDLNNVVRDVLISVADEARASEVTIETKLWKNLPTIPADFNLIREVITNLGTNAVQAMKEGGVLRLETKPDGGYLVIEVSDTGDGIPPDIQSQIWDPFFSTKKDGTGLGLAISRRIVEAHGGKISLKSKEGKGTNVMVALAI